MFGCGEFRCRRYRDVMSSGSFRSSIMYRSSERFRSNERNILRSSEMLGVLLRVAEIKAVHEVSSKFFHMNRGHYESVLLQHKKTLEVF